MTSDTSTPLDALRQLLRSRGLDGFLVPTGDAHHAEWLAPGSQRLALLTGFKGSAGTAVVLEDRLLLFTDGRYTEIAPSQIAARPLEVFNVREHCLPDSLPGMLPPGFRLGYDPWLHTITETGQLSRAAISAGVQLLPTVHNPVDEVCSPGTVVPGVAWVHGLGYAGRATLDKRKGIAAELGRRGVSTTLLSAPESICWLLNVRCSDHAETPLLYAFALLNADAEVDLFVDLRKVSAALRDSLDPGVRFHPYASIVGALDTGGHGKVLALDPAGTSQALLDLATQGKWNVVHAPDPCLLPKALKTASEITGARDCHRRDGAVLCRFWHWLESALAQGSILESQVKHEIDRLRAEDPLFYGVSFETIPASGPNAALPHYHVTRDSDRALQRGEFLLLDSGGQYHDGTTDVTRTFCHGEATLEMRRRYTLVLKSFIRAAAARFPPLTRGIQIDAVARELFWRDGVDFDHSLGHGVGSFLGVHEGPNRLRPNLTGLEPLRAGMITSIEPAFYLKDGFGVRIENLALISDAPRRPGDTFMSLHFEQLTLCPIDLRPALPELLTARERRWLNEYHAGVREALLPVLAEPVRNWLVLRTEALPTDMFAASTGLPD